MLLYLDLQYHYQPRIYRVMQRDNAETRKDLGGDKSQRRRWPEACFASTMATRCGPVRALGRGRAGTTATTYMGLGRTGLEVRVIRAGTNATALLMPDSMHLCQMHGG